MPHEQPDSLAPDDIFKGHPLTIKGDLTMTVPEPHTMVWAGRLESPPPFTEHEQQLKLFTLIGVDRSDLVKNPSPPRFEDGKIVGIDITDATGSVLKPTLVSDCTIRIFFTHK